MPGRSLRNRLLAELKKTPVVDCHSHTQNPEDYTRKDWGLFNLMSYLVRDLTGVLDSPAAGHPDTVRFRELTQVIGMPSTEAFDRQKTDAARWRLYRALLHNAGNTSYARHALVMYRELFGLRDPELNDRNWKTVHEAIRRKTKDPHWYAEVTKKRCQLVTAIRNVTPFDERWDPEYFTPVVRMESVLRLDMREGPGHVRRPRREKPWGVRFIEQGTGVPISGVRTLKRAIARLLEDYRRQGAVGVKFGHAYWRTLHHDDVPDADANRVLAKLLKGRKLTPAQVKALQDWGFRQVVRTAGDMNMVVQIHTGVQTNWGHIPDSNPLHLLNVIRAHRNVRFDLFHAGSPYARELGMLGKHYPNVWLNMCWMYVITMAGSRQILKEWIDLVPGHRLLGFGSDVGTPEFIYAHLVMARACLADVLADKVENDFLSEEVAMRLIRQMMLDNPCQLYGIRRPRT